MELSIIVDLDGTLCDASHRVKYIDETAHPRKDWNKFYEGIPGDTPNQWCVDLIDNYLIVGGYKILFVTGRPDKYRVSTEQWLHKHLPFLNDFGDSYKLFMRSHGDYRKDFIVKNEIYHNEIIDKYHVMFVIEDRKQVVDMWRQLGLVCLQCDNGNY